MKKFPPLFLAAATAIFGLSQANAMITLYEEKFDGVTGEINNTTPNISLTDATHGTGGNWAAPTNFKADGSTNTGGGSALLALTPIDGYVYTLTVSMDRPVNTKANGTVWGMVGFSEDGTISNALWQNNPDEVGPIMLWRNTGSVESFLGGGSGTNPGLDGKVVHAPSTGTTIDLGIVLDTTNSSQWTITYSVNDAVIRTENTFTNPTNLNYVGISQNDNANNQFTDFKLTVIPEPGTYALIGGCFALAFITLRRRK